MQMGMPEIVLILGNPRTGSSALTRVLSLCGCALPSKIFAADKGNAKGFWEPADAAELNLNFLIRCTQTTDATSFDRRQPLGSLEHETFIDQLRSFLRECPHESPLLIKDPLIGDLLDFWFEAATREKMPLKIIICVRHPHQTYASLGANDPASRAKLNLAWLKINLEAERRSRGLPRVFVDYSNLIRDWKLQMSRVSRALAINLSPQEDVITDFLEPQLYHHRRTDTFIDPSEMTIEESWVLRVSDLLSAAARDEVIDASDLDDLYAEYCPKAPMFGLFTPDLGRRLSEYFERRPIWTRGRDF